MKRIQVNMTEQQLGFFEELQKETGLSLSELIRRVIDEYIFDNRGKK